jgi:hypothetical protein
MSAPDEHTDTEPRVDTAADVDAPAPEDPPHILVGTSVFDGDGNQYHANVRLPVEASDEAIAGQLLRTVMATAAMYRPSVAEALGHFTGLRTPEPQQ